MVEAIVYRYRTGIAWRHLPEVFGPRQTVWTWHHRLATDSTGDAILAKLASAVDAEDQAGEWPMFPPLMPSLRVGRTVGRPRTRTDVVWGDGVLVSCDPRTPA